MIVKEKIVIVISYFFIFVFLVYVFWLLLFAASHNEIKKEIKTLQISLISFKIPEENRC